MYSQDKEEEFLLEYFKSRNDGKFLDIGAYDPFSLSNTRALYEKGWSGVMVEASPEHFLTLHKQYGGDLRIELVLAAVSTDHRLAQFYPSDGAVSTLDTKSMDKWKDSVAFGPPFWIPTVTVAELINAYGNFDFINIDAEGISPELFFHVPLQAMRPAAVCIEHNGERLVELGRFAMEHSYQQSWISQENVIYTPMSWRMKEAG